MIFGQITLERCPFEQVIMRQSGSSAHIRLMYSLSLPLPLYCTVLHFLPDSCSSKVTRRGHSQIKFGPFLLNHEVSPLDKLYLLSKQYSHHIKLSINFFESLYMMTVINNKPFHILHQVLMFYLSRCGCSARTGATCGRRSTSSPPPPPSSTSASSLSTGAYVSPTVGGPER